MCEEVETDIGELYNLLNLKDDLKNKATLPIVLEDNYTDIWSIQIVSNTSSMEE